MAIHEHTSARETVVDALRGLAVLGMVAAHAIFFFSNGTSAFLSSFERFLNTIVLTLFVFVAGTAFSRALDTYAHTGTRHRIIRLGKIAAYIYVAYAITAAIGILTAQPAIPTRELISQFAYALTLVNPPNFTEYMTLFLLFPLTGMFLHRFYRMSRQSILITLLVGAACYYLGILLYPATLPPPLDAVKELFAGGMANLRFPLLFYFPIYLLGMWWEHHMVHPSTGRRQVQSLHVAVLIAASLVSLITLAISWQYDIPFLVPGTRWPPSIGFLATGLSASLLLSFVLSAIPVSLWLRGAYRFLAYMGRDALDLWVTHLVLLFIYRRFIGVQFSDAGTVLFLFSMLTLSATLLSSITLTNRVSMARVGPVAFAPSESRRMRKRYGVMVAVIGIMLTWSFAQPPTASPYGDIMSTPAISVYDRLPADVTAELTADKTWFVRSGPRIDPIRLTLRAFDSTTNRPLKINPSSVTLTVGQTTISTPRVRLEGNQVMYEISPTTVSAGTFEVFATIRGEQHSVTTTSIKIMISEPLMVAWTFDWEGWDAPDEALSAIDELRSIGAATSFTHFINPRMFLSGVMPPDRREILTEYLKRRNSAGDELALHLHMHYDLVKAAGVTPRTSPHWGLRSNEGYDVPTSVYPTDEFRAVTTFALALFDAQGLPRPVGFRAGGWFVSRDQLLALDALGFSYDSSGRDRPTTGAFRTIPWDLPQGAQPYTLPNGVLEIPTNGTTTYEASVQELLRRATLVYNGGILTRPKALVFVSHPQFSNREFAKIPAVLNALREQSIAVDKGPVVFATMSEVYALWKSLPY